MLTKTKAAFLLTCERLFQAAPRVYFWTFTFSTLHSDWDCAKLFRDFLRHLRKHLGGDWGGVRVAELHKEHGVHYHALINRRLAVDEVRYVASFHGIGRIFVCRARKESSAYLAKYLSKGKEGPLCKSGRRARRWAKFGEIDHVKVSDLENYSPMWVFRRNNHLGFLGYRWEALLSRAWDLGEDTFRMAWELARCEKMSDLMELVLGRFEVTGDPWEHEGLKMVVDKRAWNVIQPF